MKQTNVALQTDLFNGVRAPPLESLQHNHDELVNLLSRLLWAVTVNPPQTVEEKPHE